MAPPLKMELIMKPRLENNLTAANLTISQTSCVSVSGKDKSWYMENNTLIIY